MERPGLAAVVVVDILESASFFFPNLLIIGNVNADCMNSW